MLIGIPEAGKRMGVSGDSARRALRNARVPLVRINERALAVEESDVAAFIASRVGYVGLGRPRRRHTEATPEATLEGTERSPMKAPMKAPMGAR